MGLQRFARSFFLERENRPNNTYYNRSGKSSIQRVVFGKMPPHDTLFLETTSKIQKEGVT
jgi:hypothetical protein